VADCVLYSAPLHLGGSRSKRNVAQGVELSVESNVTPRSPRLNNSHTSHTHTHLNSLSLCVCVCVNLKQDHTVYYSGAHAGASPGARLHDYWQQASKRGAVKEVRFPGLCVCLSLRDSLSVEEDLDRSFPLDPAPGRALIRDLDEERLRGLVQ